MVVTSIVLCSSISHHPTPPASNVICSLASATIQLPPGGSTGRAWGNQGTQRATACPPSGRTISSCRTRQASPAQASILETVQDRPEDTTACQERSGPSFMLPCCSTRTKARQYLSQSERRTSIIVMPLQKLSGLSSRSEQLHACQLQRDLETYVD